MNKDKQQIALTAVERRIQAIAIEEDLDKTWSFEEEKNGEVKPLAQNVENRLKYQLLVLTTHNPRFD